MGREKLIVGGVLFLVIAFVAVVLYSPKNSERWVEIPGTAGIHYDENSIEKKGNVVFVWMKNENPVAKQTSNSREIKFASAFYCGKGKIRTLKTVITSSDGFVQTSSDTHLEDNPGEDDLVDTHDLQDISVSPELKNAYETICRSKPLQP